MLLRSDGSIIDTVFEEGAPRRETRVKLRAVNGDVFVGHFQNGKKGGKGTVYYANGTVYEGFFDANKRHGEGKLYFKDGSRFEGVFMEDEIAPSVGKYWDVDGNAYEPLADKKDPGRFYRGKLYG